MEQQKVLRQFHHKMAAVKKGRMPTIEDILSTRHFHDAERNLVAQAADTIKNLTRCTGTDETCVGSRMKDKKGTRGVAVGDFELHKTRHITVSMANDSRLSKTRVFCI